MSALSVATRNLEKAQVEFDKINRQNQDAQNTDSLKAANLKQEIVVLIDECNQKYSVKRGKIDAKFMERWKLLVEIIVNDFLEPHTKLINAITENLQSNDRKYAVLAKKLKPELDQFNAKLVPAPVSLEYLNDKLQELEYDKNILLNYFKTKYPGLDMLRILNDKFTEDMIISSISNGILLSEEEKEDKARIIAECQVKVNMLNLCGLGQFLIETCYNCGKKLRVEYKLIIGKSLTMEIVSEDHKYISYPYSDETPYDFRCSPKNK